MPATKPTTDADSSEMLERDPNMRDVAYDRLQKLWLDGTIQPQQWLSQRQVVEMIDAPLAPVRDALKRMEAEGLVILQPKRGIYTLGISPKQITEIYEFRMLLEVPAVGRVAERPAFSNGLARLGRDRPDLHSAAHVAVAASRPIVLLTGRERLLVQGDWRAGRRRRSSASCARRAAFRAKRPTASSTWASAW